MRNCRLVVLLSGRGSNLGALLKDSTRPGAGYQVVAAIADRPAAGLELARGQGVPALLLDRSGFADRAGFESALATQIEAQAPDWIVLAGFMRVLSTEFVRRFADRLLNIHPSLLPAYPGLHTHARALADGISVHGASVHLVIPQLDAGPVLAQVRLLIQSGDTADSLAARLLPREHALLCACLRVLSAGWVKVQSGAFSIGTQPLDQVLVLDEDNQLVDAAGRILLRL